MKIQTKLLSNGFRVSVKSKHFDTIYPQSVWNAVPQALRTLLADTAAVFFTTHFGLEKEQILDYAFPPPQALSMFHHGLFYALPEAVLEIPEAKFTSEGLLKTLYNSGYRAKFHGHPYPVSKRTPYEPVGVRSIIPFSFGKDSLITYAVSRDIGLQPKPIFFVEPSSTYENVNKKVLQQRFQKEFNETITRFPVTLGNLRQSKGLLWGWDMLLTQYTLLLIPYLCFWKPRYFFWSNEQSINEVEKDKNGYIINTTHEQSIPWTLNLNNLLRQFSSNTLLCSIIEPLHELAILYMLHHRFREIGKYQLSCFNDSKKSRTQRWCGECYECARVYIFLLAVGVPPSRVGFVDNMLVIKKRSLYYLFESKELHRPINIVFQSWGERLLAFYLAWRRGVKGDLITLFEKLLLPQVKKEVPKLIHQYCHVHSTETIPQELKKPLLSLYTEEMERFRHEVTRETLAPIEKS